MGQVGCFEIEAMLFWCLWRGQFKFWFQPFSFKPLSHHQSHVARARGDISKIAESLGLGAPMAGNFFFAENK